MTTNPWMGRFGLEQKVSLKQLTAGNGSKPGKPSLAGLKKKPLPQKQTKQDFYAGGLLYWDAKITDHDGRGRRDGITRPVGTVSVSNGDETYVFHNKYGSWMADMSGGTMAEPARVAMILGVDVGQVEMARQIRERFDAELKVKGIPSVELQRKRIEEKQQAARKRKATGAENPWLKIRGPK